MALRLALLTSLRACTSSNSDHAEHGTTASKQQKHKIQTVASSYQTCAYFEQSAHSLVLSLDIAVSDVTNEVLEDLHVGVVAHEGLGDLRELTLVQCVLVER